MPFDHRKMRPRPSAEAPSPPPVITYRLLLETSDTLTSESGAPLRTEQS